MRKGLRFTVICGFLRILWEAEAVLLLFYLFPTKFGHLRLATSYLACHETVYGITEELSSRKNFQWEKVLLFVVVRLVVFFFVCFIKKDNRACATYCLLVLEPKVEKSYDLFCCDISESCHVIGLSQMEL